MGKKVELDEHGQPLNRFFSAARLNDRAIDMLIGMCSGVLADGMVEKCEAELLMEWMDANREIADMWPAKHIYSRIREMLQDEVLDLDEQGELLDLLTDITGGQIGCSTALPLTQPAPPVVFEENVFCLTGKFVYGSRRKCEEKIISLGGDTHPRPTHEVNYLVIGTIGSTDWIHATSGRKIEKAVQLRDEKGLPISIISEEHWIDAISKEALREDKLCRSDFSKRRREAKAARKEAAAKRGNLSIDPRFNPGLRS